MKLFDLHCDTLYELYKRNETPESNTCMISLENAKCFDQYRQVLAIWSENDLCDDEAFEQYKKIRLYLDRLKDAFGTYANFSYHLAVEGGKLLGHDIGRLYTLKEDGIKLLTLVWGGMCEIGGAHDTDEGLTPFGKDVVRECLDIGIMPDVSHSSDKTFWDTAEIFEKYGVPMIATHSNSRSVCRHMRNLTDDMFKRISQSGGIVGISLYMNHLSDSGRCGTDRIIDHIDRYMELGGENSICFGCDLDGIDAMPEGLDNIGSVPKIRERMRERGYSDELCDKIFYKNAEKYFLDNIK